MLQPGKNLNQTKIRLFKGETGATINTTQTNNAVTHSEQNVRDTLRGRLVLWNQTAKARSHAN